MALPCGRNVFQRNGCEGRWEPFENLLSQQPFAIHTPTVLAKISTSHSCVGATRTGFGNACWLPAGASKSKVTERHASSERRGEYEHGNALLTSRFADPISEAIGGGKAWVPSTGKRGAPGVAIDIPLAHKDALYVRSHYDTVTASFGDAPLQTRSSSSLPLQRAEDPTRELGVSRQPKSQGRDGLT